LSKVILLLSLNINKLQTGYIYHYTSIILIGSSLLFFFKELWYIFEFFVDYRLFIIIIILTFFIVNK